MGFGDVRLSALLGFALGYLGWAELVVGHLRRVPALRAVRASLSRWCAGTGSVLRTSYPFGPFMLVGALVGIVVGPEIWGHLVAG